MTTAEKTSIGYIGVGNMGGPMALRLCKAGFEVRVYARNKERLNKLLPAGAIACDSAREVAAKSDILFTCLTDTAAVEAVVFGPDGVAEGARLGMILVDTSTISPGATTEMGARLLDQCGAHWVDAPISGGTVGATEGTLSIFVGGRDEDFDALGPVFEVIGKNVTKMGPLGAGQVTKAINQIFVSCSIAMVAEACGLAERVGLDLAAIPGALAGGRGDSTALQYYWKRLAERDYTSYSTVTSILKDLDLVQGKAREVGAALPLTATAREYYQLLANSGHAGEDLTALARIFGDPPDL